MDALARDGQTDLAPVRPIGRRVTEAGAVTVLLVDAANVVGCRPRRLVAGPRRRDRPAARPAGRAARAATCRGPDGARCAAPAWSPSSRAGPATSPAPAGVRVVRAPGSGDDALAAAAADLAAAAPLLVVTADRGLRDRLPPGSASPGRAGCSSGSTQIGRAPPAMSATRTAGRRP